MARIAGYETHDLRFDLPDGAGSDAVHIDPQYGYATTILRTNGGLEGTGIAYTLGVGTNLICDAVDLLIEPIIGRDIEELMAEWGVVQRSIAEHSALRWLGPHKGVIHLALASITNACFDLWAKSRNTPLWELLLGLSPREVVSLVDLSYLEEVLTEDQALQIVEEHLPTRGERSDVIEAGYPAYDTSAGWMNYSDERIRENAEEAVRLGFTALKLKVGSQDADRDVRRVGLVREAVGPDVHIMLDANQAWSLPTALRVCERLAAYEPYWIEEPTQPDDVGAHRTLAEAIAPIPVAVGETVSNRVIWKNFLQAGAVGIVQADCTRLAGVSEYLAVVLMARQFPVHIVPHVGDMGQIHRHLVLFNRIALGHELLFVEYIPHLRDYFVHPAVVREGRYVTPCDAGSSTQLHPHVIERCGV